MFLATAILLLVLGIAGMWILTVRQDAGKEDRLAPFYAILCSLLFSASAMMVGMYGHHLRTGVYYTLEETCK